MGVNITNQFHTYRVDWDPKKMVFYFDGQPYWSISIDKIMQSPFYKGKTKVECVFPMVISFVAV